MPRLAVIDKGLCKPKDCGHECRKYCPMVRSGLDVIVFEDLSSPPKIIEPLCNGCGICVKKCPFHAIAIVNIAEELEEESFHRYGLNAFKLFRFIDPPKGKVTGLLGKNGTGKTTILKIISGQILPNLGNIEKPPSREDVLRFLRGTTTATLLRSVWDNEAKIVYKPQYIDKLPKVVKGSVKEILSKVDERGVFDEAISLLELDSLTDRDISHLSGGELQRLAMAAVYVRDGDIFLLDEPSSFLDIRQRLKLCEVVNRIAKRGKTVIIVEHDLSILDYVSDYVHIVYGAPGVYGVVSKIMATRVAINSYLQGFIKPENLRFRAEPIIFHEHSPPEYISGEVLIGWPNFQKKLGDFKLYAEKGEVHRGEVVGVIGPNGIGKTTFVKSLLELFKGSESLIISYKPQYITGLFKGNVGDILRKNAGREISDWFYSSLISPLGLDKLLDRDATTLSGGELQSLAIASALLRNADMYFIDEPCAYLDVEQRMTLIRVLRRIVEERQVSALVVEHDVIAIDFLSDRLIVFEGEPGSEGHANSPRGMRDGMNLFLKALDITFRRDPDTKRPRINKPGSKLDRLQKERGEYYYA
ncbi:ribosome biogenesis/translation initiation ATPase RLI [Candidatus Bathyarchaeota archaeon ex4484_205]|nr:MAG: ribosome biogenesis/translation initiation ATPase RLI [Candidatus Bathyarchaeota archaeon ex4484_205]RLG68681.1 MAG: ribosome biogenesis/translation initiation ATPase RLI [archaeon]